MATPRPTTPPAIPGIEAGSDDRAQTPPHAHFSQGGLGTGGGVPPAFGAILPLMLPAMLIGVPILLLVGLDRFPWMPLGVRVTIVTLLCVAGLWWAFGVMKRGYQRGVDIKGLPLQLDEDHRVNVICWNDQRRRLEPYADEAFEPERFRIFLPTPPPKWLSDRVSPGVRDVIRAQGLSLLASLFYLPAVFGYGWISVVILAAALPIAAWRYRKPTYVRIAPGRVDILRYPFLGGPDARPDIEPASVRVLPVRLDLKQHALRVGPWSKKDLPQIVGTNPQGRDPALFTLPLWPIVGRAEAEVAIYRACISTAEPGPLDDDEPAPSDAAVSREYSPG